MKTDTATKINNLHAAFCKAIRKPVEIAIQLGELLTKQKKECPHGTWIPWIETNLKFDRRQATRYITAFRNWGGKTLPPNLTIEDASRVFYEDKFDDSNGAPPPHLPQPQRKSRAEESDEMRKLREEFPTSAYAREFAEGPKPPDVEMFMKGLETTIYNLFQNGSALGQKLNALVEVRDSLPQYGIYRTNLVTALRLAAKQANRFADQLDKDLQPQHNEKPTLPQGLLTNE